MLRSRIIPVLLMQNAGLIKTRRFGSPKYVGDPINAVRIFNEKEVDELAIFDIDAWKVNGPRYELLSKIARESRMPLCYGGGINTVEQAETIINLGYEKISVSRGALRKPGLVGQIAARVGSQSCVVTLDVRKDSIDGCYYVFTENGTKRETTELFKQLRPLIDEGAGELVINCIERDGEMCGYDIPLAKSLYDRISIPLTIVGGAGTVAHMASLIEQVGILGVGAGSLFVFKGPFRAVLISYARP